MALMPSEYDGGRIAVGWKTSSAVTINAESGASMLLVQNGSADLTGYHLVGVIKALVSGNSLLCIRGYDTETHYVYAVNPTSSAITIPSGSECLKCLYEKD